MLWDAALYPNVVNCNVIGIDWLLRPLPRLYAKYKATVGNQVTLLSTKDMEKQLGLSENNKTHLNIQVSIFTIEHMKYGHSC